MMEPAFLIQSDKVQASWTAGPYPKGINKQDVSGVFTLPTDAGVATVDSTVKTIKHLVNKLRDHPTTCGADRHEGVVVIVMVGILRMCMCPCVHICVLH